MILINDITKYKTLLSIVIIYITPKKIINFIKL